MPALLESHRGNLVIARKRAVHVAKAALTSADRSLIVTTYKTLAKSMHKRPRPQDVAVKLGRHAMGRIPASSLRKVLRKFQIVGQKSMRSGPAVWTADLTEYFDKHRSPDDDVVCCIHRSLGPLATSFVLRLPPFFDELAKLKVTGAITASIVGAADTTFEVEFQGYTFNQLFAQVYPRVQGRWRKTPWPLALMCHPRECKRSYAQIFFATNTEFIAERLAVADADALGLLSRLAG
jgi:hypothetical protein